MRSILIDPTTKTVTEIECGGDGDIAKVIDAACRYLVGRIDDGRGLYNGLFVDDMGLLVDNPGPFFMFKYPLPRIPRQPFAGKGLVCGIKKKGEYTDASLTAEHIRTMVYFPDNVVVFRDRNGSKRVRLA